MPRLSLCLIARDEEAMLPGCLASVRGIVDEIVVVDTGSRDATAEIARRAGARVVPFAWRDDFAAARNAALAAATGDWILVLDADERLGPGAADALRAAMRSPVDCGLLPLHDATRLDADPADVIAGRARRGEPTLLPRLLRRSSDLAWDGVVHESVGAWITRGKRKTGRVDAPIVHLGAVPELRAARGKDDRNRRLLERRCELEPDNAVARTYLARELIRAGEGARARAEVERAWDSLRAALAAGHTPSVVPLLTLRAHLLLEDDRAADVDAMLDLFPTLSHPNLDLLRGLARERLGDLPAAEAALRRALARHGETHPDEVLPGATSWAASRLLGQVLLAARRPREALAAYDAALVMQPADPEARLGRAEALLGDQPAVALREVEPLLGQTADAWIVAAAACDALGAVAERRGFVARALSAGPPSRHRAPLLHALRAIDALAEPLADLRLPRVNGPDAAALVAEGERRAEDGDAATAFACWFAALRRDLGSVGAWVDIAAALHAIGRADAAAALLRGALRVVPDHPELLATLALVLLDRGEGGEAARLSRRLLQLDPAHPVPVQVLEELGVHGAGGPVLPDPRIAPLLGDEPLISVIVPCHGRPGPLRNLLDRLALQDVDRRAFEVIVVDDGSPEPVTDSGPRPFSLRLLRQPNAGPAAARNLALQYARGRFVLIYNDDALPERDGVRRHLHAQLDAREPEAVLGSFDFLPEHQEDPFVELLQGTDLLFGFASMRAGQRYGWQCFWTCNLSVPRIALDAVDGFDAAFPRALVEDVELGWRLEKRLGLRVRYLPEIRSAHDHVVTWEAWLARQERLGHEIWRMYRKHRAPGIVPAFRDEEPDAAFWLAMRARQETQVDAAERLAVSVRATLRRGVPAGREDRHKLVAAVRSVGVHRYERGLVQAAAAFPPGTRPRPTPRRGTTSIILPNLNGFPHVEGCLDTLRAHTSTPTEVIVVDNGSTDGSLEWLRRRGDVRVLEMGENLGAPAARNRGLAVASGERVLFCDNDVLFTPRWHEILVGHLEAWPDIGMVGPVSDYVVDAQKAARPPAEGEELDAYATALHAELRGRHAYTTQLILYFILARREVIEQIGGIDERFGRWGWEDNDWSLRARIAGWQLRIVQDCFIRHLGSRTSKTASIDYRRLLLENWEVFKRKWGVDPALPYGERLDIQGIVARPFDPALHFVPFRA